MRRLSLLSVLLLLVLGAGCSSGGDGGGGAPPPPPPPPPPPAGIGPAGGTVNGPGGSSIVVPANALAANTVIAIAQSSNGAPALPAELEPAGDMFAITPHGTAFAVAATVTIPFDPADVPAGRTLQLMKTNAAQNGWETVAGATTSGNALTAQTSSLSWWLVALEPTLPVITSGPADITVVAGSSATFMVVAANRGGATLEYQWQRDGIDIAGATLPSYEVPSAAITDDNTLFSVLVSNGIGTVSSLQAILTVVAQRGASDVVSLDPAGAFGNGNSGLTSSPPALSEDGRYVAFLSLAGSLVQNANCGIYLRDMDSLITQLVTVKPDGSPSLGSNCSSPLFAEVAITPDARYVVFTIDRGDLVDPPPPQPNPPAYPTHVYVRDTCIDATNACTPKTTVVSIDDSGNFLPSILSTDISISDDGRYVSFVSAQRAFVHDRDADGNSIYDERPAIPDPSNPTYRSFVVSHSVNFIQVWASQPMISGNGRHIVYIAETNLVECSQQGVTGICTFVHDRDADNDGVFDEDGEPGGVSWTNVSRNNADEIALGGQVVRPWISRDGRIVSFRTIATNMGADGSLFPRYALDRDLGGTGAFDQPGNRQLVLATVDENGNQISRIVSDPMRSFGHSGRFMLMVGPGNWASPPLANVNASQVFLRDLCMGADVPTDCVEETVRLSVRNPTTLPVSTALGAALSPNARRVAFGQTGGGLVDLDADGSPDIHSSWQIYRGWTGTNELVPVGAQNIVTVVVSGPTGSGFVSGPFSAGSGGNRCDAGDTCSLPAAEGGYAILFAEATPGFVFQGWTGPCSVTPPALFGCWGDTTGNPTFTATFE